MQIRLGTRGSQLALAQAEIVKHKLMMADASLQIDICPIMTQGDKDLKSPLYAIGGKGVFIKELEMALMDNAIDIAVHSLKDMTTTLASGTQLTGFLAAESVWDVLILKQPHQSLQDLPQGAILATGSLRRKALLKKLRPDINTVEIRGNVLTRLDKLRTENFQGLLLSEAGLIRLHQTAIISQRLDPTVFCPAPGQGVIALQTHSDKPEINDICLLINDELQRLKSMTELAFLEKVGLDCRAPLGAYAVVEDSTISLHAFIADKSMEHFFERSEQFVIGQHLQGARALADEFLVWLSSMD